MKMDLVMKMKEIRWKVFFLFTVAVCMSCSYLCGIPVYAEEPGAGGSLSGTEMTEVSEEDVLSEEETEAPGTYTMEEGWIEDEELSTDDVLVYRLESAAEDTDIETSTISCSYMDTNYSRQEYEQLRDMLTNNLLYSNVDAQITTSAVYTLAKDYLYIILVDDSLEDYRTIYHYVVGDYQCFCVEVKEYREEAEQAELLEEDTPQEIGQKVAEGFSWKEE